MQLQPLQSYTSAPSAQAVTSINNLKQTPTVSRDDIEWAVKLDKKMEYGLVPSMADQQRYNAIVQKLHAIKEGGGYAYQDTTSFSNNPRGFAAIGSMVGRGLSGGYIGYRYSGEVASVTNNMYHGIKDNLAAGQFGSAFKDLGIGMKHGSILALKAGGIGMTVSSGVSLISNAAEAVAGRQTGKEAVGNVAADAVGGFISGIGASTLSGVATMGFSVAGMASGSLPITVVGVVGGVVGSLLMDKIYKASGLFTMVKNRTANIFGKEPKG